MAHICLNKVIRPGILRVAEEDCWKSKLVLRIINKYQNYMMNLLNKVYDTSIKHM